MSKFKRFMYLFLAIEVALLVVCNYFLFGELKEDDSNYYKVEISRIVTKIGNGEGLDKLDLSEYPHIISVSRFDSGERVKRDYAVERVDGVLYRFEYQRDGINQVLLVFNLIYCFIILVTIGLCVYLDRKIISPFKRMNSMTTELAKGNLAVPIKQEKSKYFKDFLWGLDMLREKLEMDKKRELELLKEKKLTVLSLSHDIKTPLSACDLYAKALKKDLYKSEEERRDAISGIETNVAKIRDYVGDIVEASKEDFLALEVQNTEVYLDSIMNEIDKYYQDKCSQLHIEFVLERAENCLIYGDLDKLVEVLQNIMENAIKYGDGRLIRISTSSEENCKLITVTNSGVIPSKEELPHLFESFYRGSNCRNVEGSGLGLFICKELMHRMDGDIFVRADGKQFEVTLVVQKI